MLLKKIKGQEIELRHILLSPTVTDESLTEAKEKITLIKRIEDKGNHFCGSSKNLIG
jgi:peptidyl-prolyl cis-trans isomerase SurA